MELSRGGKPDEKTSPYAIVDDAMALLWLVNLGCIDLNPWQSRADAPDEPTHVLFDLDPADGLPFTRVVEAARMVGDALEGLGLRGYPRTSGATGMHILVPVMPGLTFDTVRLFARVVCEALVRARPDLVTTVTAVADRGPRVYLDANQNGRGRSIASVYSVRPRPGAPVATPLRWDEVREGLEPAGLHHGRRGAPGGARGRPVARVDRRPPEPGRCRGAPGGRMRTAGPGAPRRGLPRPGGLLVGDAAGRDRDRSRPPPGRPTSSAPEPTGSGPRSTCSPTTPWCA